MSKGFDISGMGMNLAAIALVAIVYYFFINPFLGWSGVYDIIAFSLFSLVFYFRNGIFASIGAAGAVEREAKVHSEEYLKCKLWESLSNSKNNYLFDHNVNFDYFNLNRAALANISGRFENGSVAIAPNTEAKKIVKSGIKSDADIANEVKNLSRKTFVEKFIPSKKKDVSELYNPEMDNAYLKSQGGI